MLQFLNAEHTRASFTDESGSIWAPIHCAIDEGEIRILGDGEIQRAARAFLDQNGDEAALPYVAPATTNADVNAERDRRVAAGKTFAITGYGDIPVSGDATTQLNLLALKDTARDLKAASVTAAVIPYRDADNAQHMLTADQIIELVDAGKAHVQMLYSASWTLKAMDPIPADLADDSYWS